MKLNDLIEALAAEVEIVQPQLNECLDKMATLDVDDPACMDALEQYTGQVQRMGEAAEMAGFPGLQAVCNHVMNNTMVLPSLEVAERGPVVQFLREWPPLIVYHLRNISDPSTAAGLVDHLVHAPYPMEEDEALKVMHMLGAMPGQAMDGGDGQPMRPVLATPEDVALVMPADVDPGLRDGFFHEAPEMARNLVDLSRKMSAGQGTPEDLVVAKRVAHTLKGSGAIIGLRGLASLGHHFEDVLEHFEREGGIVVKQAANALLDAAYCLEQMVGYVAGTDDYPEQAQSVLQNVLDVANRIDHGESLDQPLTRVAPPPPVEREVPASVVLEGPDEVEVAQEPAVAVSQAQLVKHMPATPASQAVAPSASQAPALRVTVQRVDELFRVSGEVSVHSAAMEARIKVLTERSRELLAQNLRVQKRLFELETLVDVRALTMMRSGSQRSEAAAFDPLEMDQYSELHSTTHALMEEAADARALASRLEDDIAQLGGVQTHQQRLSKDLQHLVIGTRMTEVSALESRLQRNVRSTCQATGKQANLVLLGGDTQIDGDVLNRLADPLLHLMRNAVDHGLETPAERLALGKSAEGQIELSFTRQGQQVVLVCKDDGRGLDLPAIRKRAIERGLITAEQALSDDEVARLILLAGFSTRDQVSEVSGRGVGLDVVRDWASAMNGSIRISTNEGAGSAFELRFAATLSTMQSLIVEVSGQRFALPSLQIEQAVPRGVGTFEYMGEQLVYRHGKRLLSAVRLADPSGLLVADDKPLNDYDAVIIKLDDKVQVLAVDHLIDSRELLVKNPGRYAGHVRGVAGLSILGDGSVAVNLDLAQLLNTASSQRRAASDSGVKALAGSAQTLPNVLIVDDALSVRTSLLQLVQDAGYRAETARDGVDAVEKLRKFRPDVVLTDLEMPNMNGVELTMHLRGRGEFKKLPIIMITSRSQEKHRRLAEQAGVNKYITKPYNDGDLLQTLRQSLVA